MGNAIEITDKIHEQAETAAREYKRSEAVLLAALIQVDTHRVFIRKGFASLFDYCVRALGLSEAVTCTMIAVARKAREVPALMTAIEQKEITLSNARRIAPVITRETQNEWLQKGAELSSRQLEKAVAEVRPQEAVREKAGYVNGDRMKVELGMFEREFLRFRRAQDLLSRKRGRAATLEETMTEMLNLYLGRHDPLMRAKRVIAKKGHAAVSASGQLANSNFNAELKQTLSNQSVARQEQARYVREAIPAAILHEVRLRDGERCAHEQNGERCQQRRWLEIHHIVPVSKGGANEAGNLTTLCSAHHKYVHEV